MSIVILLSIMVAWLIGQQLAERPGHAILRGTGFAGRPHQMIPARFGERDAFENIRRNMEFGRRRVKERWIVCVLHFLREFGDGDFVALLEYLQMTGQLTETVAFGKSCSGKIKELTDHFIDLDEAPRKYLMPMKPGRRRA